MNEQKRLYIILGVICAIIVLIMGINFVNEYNTKKYLETYDTAMASEERHMIVIGRDNCVYCQMFIPLLDYMKEQYGFDYLYINTNKITKKGLNRVLDELNVDKSKFGTPHVSLIENGKVIDEILGYVDEKEVLTFLQKYGYAPEDATLPINYVDYSQYEKLIASSTPQLIVIGQTSCSACMMAKPSLLEIGNKYGVKINYLNLTELQTSDNGSELITKFNNSLAFLTEESWGTPLMIVVKNNEVIASSKGFLSTDTYVSFLKEQGFIGE